MKTKYTLTVEAKEVYRGLDVTKYIAVLHRNGLEVSDFEETMQGDGVRGLEKFLGHAISIFTEMEDYRNRKKISRDLDECLDAADKATGGKHQ